MPVGTHYGDTSISEDVHAIIYQITPLDAPLYNMIGDTRAMQPLHQWERRSLASTRTLNAQVEGNTYTFAAPDLSTRVTNLTQIIGKFPRVSRTAQASSRHTIPDLVREAIANELAKWKTDAEHALVRGSQASGNASNSARQMGGLHNVLTTNATAHASGTTFSEDNLNSFSNTIWSGGGRPGDILVGGTLKRRISSFVGGATKNFDQVEKEVVNVISRYMSDFALFDVHLSRDMLTGTNANSIAFVDRNQFSKAWLDQVVVKRVADIADSIDHTVIGELTLEFGNEAASGLITATN